RDLQALAVVRRLRPEVGGGGSAALEGGAERRLGIVPTSLRRRPSGPGRPRARCDPGVGEGRERVGPGRAGGGHAPLESGTARGRAGEVLTRVPTRGHPAAGPVSVRSTTSHVRL